jgi:hypothetical protein
MSVQPVDSGRRGSLLTGEEIASPGKERRVRNDTNKRGGLSSYFVKTLGKGARHSQSQIRLRNDTTWPIHPAYLNETQGHPRVILRSS